MADTHIIYDPEQTSREISVTSDDIKNIMYTGQTGKFPIVSSQGNRYIMVLYEKDGNLIFAKPMKTRLSGDMCRAYQKLKNQLHDWGVRVVKHILDNEASEDYLQAM